MEPLLTRLGATLCDIRLSPRSRVPHWRGPALQQLLGARYRHIPALGNVNYKRKKSEPIELADVERGIGELLAVTGAVVLLCACADVAHCHRRVVAEHLQAHAVTVLELKDWR